MIPDLDEWINTLLDCKPYIYKKIAMDFVHIGIRPGGYRKRANPVADAGALR